MLDALLWGTVAASSLLIGAILGIVHTWPKRLVGGVLAFGGGALIASVSFELAEEGIQRGGPWPVGIGLAAGALSYYLANRLVSGQGLPVGGHHGRRFRHSQDSRRHAGGTSLAVGAVLDGIPEQLVLGIGLAGGAGVSASLLVAIFVSNLPESIGSSSDMIASGSSRRRVTGLWIAVTVVCLASTVLGYLIADLATGGLRGFIDGFAAGALLVMLVDSLIPEAQEKAGNTAGLVTVLGFSLATFLSLVA
ncbi:ZIP family metal transporter [Tersicoccus sp. Bi-70]|uniref:ZIP family metal transporter n=1 Tax=Tersicoccus sp. Bi-70 TaxID=1897634 RepID=UPI000976E6DB|nr:hypothetical protein [Tersicoccus sp. Bi-70]OMH31243.1 hypothetical protein BGP79_09375 [Tersicoccus sp. Bi-70]